MGFLKKIMYLVGAAAVTVVGIRLQQDYNAKLEAKKQEAYIKALPSAPPAAPTSGQSASPSAPQNAPLESKKPKPVIDPATGRALNSPLPGNLRDLLTKLTDFKEPLLPKTNITDADVKAVYRGFYEVEPGKFRRIEFTRSDAYLLSLEDLQNRFPVWQEAKDDFVLNNYNDDLYSVVMTLRDMRVLYLKFYTGRRIPDYSESNFRVLSGWIIDSGGKRTSHKVALIDGRHTELGDPRAAGQFIWPRLGTIQLLMPQGELSQ